LTPFPVLFPFCSIPTNPLRSTPIDPHSEFTRPVFDFGFCFFFCFVLFLVSFVFPSRCAMHAIFNPVVCIYTEHYKNISYPNLVYIESTPSQAKPSQAHTLTLTPQMKECNAMQTVSLPPGGFFSFLPLVVAGAHAALDLGGSDRLLGSRGHPRVGIAALCVQVGLDTGKSFAGIRDIAVVVEEFLAIVFRDRYFC